MKIAVYEGSQKVLQVPKILESGTQKFRYWNTIDYPLIFQVLE